MKRLNILFFAIFLLTATWSCQNGGGIGGGSGKISGTIANAANLQAFLDLYSLSKANRVIAKADLDGKGTFSIPLEEGIEPGMYRLRIGAKKIFLVLDGKENNIKITGDINTLDQYAFTVEGSSASLELVTAMNKIATRQMDVNGAKAAIQGAANPLTSMALANLAFGKSPEFLDLHKEIQTKVAQQYPNSEYIEDYSTFIMNQTNQAMANQVTGPVDVGSMAPEIRLSSPNGKIYALSDLKGKVVLLDFWASWCGPCRRENPNVVKVYDKYNKKGFEVFSVSLDRPDGKEKWMAAIKQDNLKWKYHVSDLQFWNSAPARLYGVSSIPRTFLIDKEGKIVAANLRGAEAIEAELQKHL